MEAKLIVLKLFLDELGITPSIDTVEDRKYIQKSVYLGQLTGVDLGYRYGWYKMGPYCPSLANDYYRLAEAIETESEEFSGKELQDSIRQKLSNLKPILEAPNNDINEKNWLEFLASYDYLVRVSKFNKADAIETINEQKPHLSTELLYIDAAETKLNAIRTSIDG